MSLPPECPDWGPVQTGVMSGCSAKTSRRAVGAPLAYWLWPPPYVRGHVVPRQTKLATPSFAAVREEPPANPPMHRQAGGRSHLGARAYRRASSTVSVITTSTSGCCRVRRARGDAATGCRTHSWFRRRRDKRGTRRRAAGRWPARESLDAGADPVIVAGWISQVQGERIHAERDLVAAQPSGKLAAEQVRSLVDGLTHFASVLAGADPKLKAKLYEKLGITVRYDRSIRIVAAQSRPQVACATVSAGGGL